MSTSLDPDQVALVDMGGAPNDQVKPFPRGRTTRKCTKDIAPDESEPFHAQNQEFPVPEDVQLQPFLPPQL